MNKDVKRLGVWMIAATVVLVSCGEDKNDEPKEVSVDVKDDDTDRADSSEFIRLPTPTQFFEVISRIGGEAREDLVNPVSKISDYTTSTSQALNFGVYFADLAYLMEYNQNTKSLEYFEALKKLADKLSVSAVFSEEVMQRMADNNTEKDSVYTYSNEVYFNAYSYLEEEKKGDVLSLMLIGGWVESMHIVTNLVDGFSADDEIINEIAQQNVVLESIYEHAMIASAKNPDLEEWVIALEDIKGIYDESIKSNATKSKKDENGRLIISGGSVVVLDELAFGTIVEKVNEMRSRIVNAE